MKNSRSRSMDLVAALRVLKKSTAFRMATRTVKTQLLVASFVLIIATIVGLIAIDAQAGLLVYLGASGTTDWTALPRLFAFFVLAQILFETFQWGKRSLQNRISVAITDALRRAIFKKYSEMRYSDLQLVSSGDVAQLHASDASQLAGVWAEGILSFAATLVLTLGVSLFLTVQVGVSGLVFFVVLIVLIILAQRFARRTAPTLQKRAEYSALRLSVIQESVRSIFLVKALTAEDEFERRIAEKADLEQDMKLQANDISCAYVPVFASLRWLGWAGLLLWVVYMPKFYGNPLPPATLVGLVFSVNWYSSLLQDSFLFVGTYLSFIQVGAVSALRLDQFLDRPSRHVQFYLPAQANVDLALEDVVVDYPTRVGQWALDSVNVSAQQGKLTVIVGPVGAGKSTLLRTLLGELTPSRGKVIRRSPLKVAYLSQDVALPSASLRDVLRYEFENSGHEDIRLSELLELAEFAPDLESLPGGLSTAVGERGVTLSGGQRLRVGLAQLSYFSEADALLLDDPLAALDSATAEALMASLICGLWAGKTRIVTTHSATLIDRADWVVRLEGGRVVEQGPSRSRAGIEAPN
ncbi:ABC transporter ATP-binding protein [bacterium]|nr:ABC transporter ATP-binding protein [bacterium]